MTKTWAEDPMGLAANEAAISAHLFQFRLLGASSAYATREQRAASLRAVFEQWPHICAAMEELADSAPNIAREFKARRQAA